ncbi:MAG: Flp family type IVb pilin [Acetobacter sp.]
MKMLKNGFARCARLFAGDRKGVTALEYGLIAALIAGVIITGVTALGNNVNEKFGNLATKISSS